MPLILLPEVTFQAGHLPYGPTMEGQYIIKNLLILSAALVVGGTVRRSEEAVTVSRSKRLTSDGKGVLNRRISNKEQQNVEG